MNIVVLMGNVASEPQLYPTGSDRQACTFRLAVTRLHDASEADFIQVVTFDTAACRKAEDLEIGQCIHIEGRLHSHFEQTNDDTTPRPVAHVIATHIRPMGSDGFARSFRGTPAQQKQVAAS